MGLWPWGQERGGPVADLSLNSVASKWYWWMRILFKFHTRKNSANILGHVTVTPEHTAICLEHKSKNTLQVIGNEMQQLIQSFANEQFPLKFLSGGDLPVVQPLLAVRGREVGRSQARITGAESLFILLNTLSNKLPNLLPRCMFMLPKGTFLCPGSQRLRNDALQDRLTQMHLIFPLRELPALSPAPFLDQFTSDFPLC